MLDFALAFFPNLRKTTSIGEIEIALNCFARSFAVMFAGKALFMLDARESMRALEEYVL